MFFSLSGLIDNNHIIDETGLKNYLHRLLRDEDRERQASLIRKLKIFFEHPENFKVFHLSFCSCHLLLVDLLTAW